MTEIVPSVSPGASPFDALRQVDPDGREYWSARDLAPPFGYPKYERFAVAVERARAACANSGRDPESDLRPSSKIATNARGERRTVPDFRLTRYGAYLAAMNGDPRKPEIAAAQTYFAVKTREAETRPAVTAGPLDELEVAERYVLAIKEKRAALVRAETAEARAAALEPLAAAGRTFTEIKGTVSVAVAAGHLSNDLGIKVGRDRLFTKMRDIGWICREGRGAKKYWRAKAHAIDSGRLQEYPNPYLDPETGDREFGAPTIQVTSKGLADLYAQYYGEAQGRFPWEDAG